MQHRRQKSKLLQDSPQRVFWPLFGYVQASQHMMGDLAVNHPRPERQRDSHQCPSNSSLPLSPCELERPLRPQCEHTPFEIADPCGI